MRESPPATEATARGVPTEAGARDGRPPLRDQVEAALDAYLAALGDELPRGLYAEVMHEVELPILRSVMRHVGHNQSRAADALGISRGTLRKKLRTHGLR